MPPPWALGAALEGAAAPGGWCPVAGGATLAATGAGVATTVAAEGMGRGRPASWVAPALEARADHEERGARPQRRRRRRFPGRLAVSCVATRAWRC